MTPRARAAAVGAAACVAALATLSWRFLTFSGFTNDHYVHLARAQQMVLGAWPVRDFVDPGMPLMYGVSAVARLLGGRAMWVEWAVVATAFAGGAALTLVAAARLSGGLAIAAVVTALQIVLNPRSYCYPKITLYALAGWLFVRAAEQPGRSRVGLLGILAAVAFLFRHDHGLYILFGATALVACRQWSQGPARAVLHSALPVLVAAALLAPWALYVEHYDGLLAYFQSGIEFSRREAAATLIETWPRITLGGGLGSTSNAHAWLFYLFHLLPFAAVLVAWRRALRGHAGWSGELAAVVGIAAMAVPANLGFLREELGPRIPDAAVPASLLGAYVLGAAWSRRFVAGIGRAAFGSVVTALVLITAAGSALTADLTGQMDRARILNGTGALAGRVQDLWIRLGREMPESEQVPSRYAAALMPFFAYMQRCTDPSDRLLVTSLTPEAYVLANRGFAGGHVAFFSGYYSGAADQRLAVERMRREPVPVVILSDGLEQFRAEMPIVAAYVDQRYSKGAEIEVDEVPPLRLYFERASHPATDRATGWPCPSAR